MLKRNAILGQLAEEYQQVTDEIDSLAQTARDTPDYPHRREVLFRRLESLNVRLRAELERPLTGV